MVKCLIEGCNREAKVRGLCDPCYQAARVEVKRGRVTWEQLEFYGLIEPKHEVKSSTGAFKAALASKIRDAVPPAKSLPPMTPAEKQAAEEYAARAHELLAPIARPWRQAAESAKDRLRPSDPKQIVAGTRAAEKLLAVPLNPPTEWDKMPWGKPREYTEQDRRVYWSKVLAGEMTEEERQHLWKLKEEEQSMIALTYDDYEEAGRQAETAQAEKALAAEHGVHLVRKQVPPLPDEMQKIIDDGVKARAAVTKNVLTVELLPHQKEAIKEQEQEVISVRSFTPNWSRPLPGVLRETFKQPDTKEQDQAALAKLGIRPEDPARDAIVAEAAFNRTISDVMIGIRADRDPELAAVDERCKAVIDGALAKNMAEVAEIIRNAPDGKCISLSVDPDDLPPTDHFDPNYPGDCTGSMPPWRKEVKV